MTNNSCLDNIKVGDILCITKNSRGAYLTKTALNDNKNSTGLYEVIKITDNYPIVISHFDGTRISITLTADIVRIIKSKETK